MPVRPRRLRCSRRATSCPRPAVRPRRCPRARRTRYGQTCWERTLGLVKVSSRAERAGGVWRDAVEDAARYGRCTNMFCRRVVVNDGTSSTVSTTTTMRSRTTAKTMTKATTTTTTTMAATTVTVTRRLRLRLPLRLRQRRRQRRQRRRRRRWR